MLYRETHIPGIGGMNLDVADELLKPEETRHLYNGRRTISQNSKKGNISNIKGTIEANAEYGLTDAAITTGTVVNYENQTIIYFVSDNYNSGIFEFNPEYNATNVILQPKDGVLNFSRSFDIHGFVINGMLYWNGGGELHKLNIEKAKLFSSGDKVNGYPLVDTQTISLIKYPPTNTIKPYYQTDDSRAINNLRGKLFQFRYSYIYDDYEESKASPISVIAIPKGEMDYSGEIAGQLNKNNIIVLPINTGHHTVIKIRIYAREGNNGNWGLVETIDKLGKGLSNQVAFEYKFYNSRMVLIADQKKIDQLFDSIPNKAQRITYLHTNQMAIAGLTEGYDNISGTDVILTPETEKLLAVQKGAFVKGWQVRADRVAVGETTYRSGKDVYGITMATLPAANNIVSIVINGHEETFLASTDDVSDVNIFREKLCQIITSQYDGFAAVYSMATQFGDPITDDEIFVWDYYDDSNTNFTVTVKEYQTVGDAYTPFPGFKSGATHPFGIVYYDEANRSGFANEIGDVYLPFVTEPDAPVPKDGVKAQNSRYSINWKINHRPPSWAVRYQFVYGKNNDVLQFRQYIIGGAKAGTTATTDIDPDKMALDITPLNRSRNQYNGLDFSFPNSSIQPYEFQKGDRVRFITKSKTDFSTSDGLGGLLDYYLDVEIMGYVITPPDTSNPDVKQVATNNILINKIDVTKYPGIGGNTLIEIYTPKKELSETIYYEFGESYKINNPHSESRSHAGLTSDQVFDGSGNLTKPASGVFYNGDTYMVPTVFSKNLSGDLNQIVLSIVEGMSASNFYNQDTHNYGRVNIGNKDFSTVTNNPIIRLSDKYFEGTEINGLSSFGTQFEANVSKESGGISGLSEIGYTLKIIQPHKVTSFYISMAGIQLASGGSIEANSDQSIGTKTPSIEDYGTSNPESVFVKGEAIYFVDVNRGVIVRNSQNGNFEISKYGIKTEIKKVCSEVKQADKYRIITSYNPITEDIMFTFWGRNGEASLNEFTNYGTYIYVEESNKWDAIFYYEDINGRPPEAFSFIGTDYVSFIGGHLFHHEKNNLMNTFYGKPAKLSVEMVFNKGFGESKQFKVFIIAGRGRWSCPDDVDVTVPASYSVIGSEQNSRLKQSRFKKLAGKQYAYFLKDVNTFKNKPLFSLLNGNDLKGQLLFLTIVTSDVTGANLNIASLDYKLLQLT